MEAKRRWDVFASTYQRFDPPLQSFYYTLLHMMAIDKATHILDVACGTCRMVPECLRIKPKQCTYLATDISDNMLEYAQINLGCYIEKMGICQSFKEFCQRHLLELAALNAQDKLPELPYQVDRIIINLMLMAAKNPVQILKNLHQVAAPGCLLGVTIWGNKQNSNLLRWFSDARMELGLEKEPSKSLFDFYNCIEEVGKEAGWELVQQWDQTVAHNITEVGELLELLIQQEGKGDEKVAAYVRDQAKKVLDSKQALVFSAQLAILRKK